VQYAYYDGHPSVYVPGGLGEKKNLPVVFWIHGYLLVHLSTNFNLIICLSTRGGYIFGNASAFNGNDLVREAGGGVVAVFIQYRLGVLGFLPGEKVKEGGALNAGLRKY
jgi:carboxylesterase type B